MENLSLERTNIPLYVQLQQILKSKIIIGELAPGTRIPTEKELCGTYQVSSITARQAILNLVEEGLLYRQQGRGTFVREGASEVKNIMTLNAKGEIKDIVPENLAQQKVEVIDISFIPSPKRISQVLNLTEGEEITQVRRIRSDNGEPVSYVKNYLAADIGKEIKKEDLQNYSMLYILRNKIGIPLKNGTQYVEAVIADYEIATALSVSISSPILYLETIIFTGNEKPVEFVQTFYRSDRYKYTVNLVYSEPGSGRIK